MNTASQVPSGVVMVTSRSAVSIAAIAGAAVATARPAAAAEVTKSRRGIAASSFSCISFAMRSPSSKSVSPCVTRWLAEAAPFQRRGVYSFDMKLDRRQFGFLVGGGALHPLRAQSSANTVRALVFDTFG